MSFEYNPRTGNPRRILRRRLGLQLLPGGTTSS